MIDGGRDEWINNGMTDRNGPWTKSTKVRRDVGAASTKPRKNPQRHEGTWVQRPRSHEGMSARVRCPQTRTT